VLRRGAGSVRLELFSETEPGAAGKLASDEEGGRRTPQNTRPRFVPQQQFRQPQRQRPRPSRPNRRND
jgi:hypothetical protein